MGQTRYAIVLFLIVASTLILSFSLGGAPTPQATPSAVIGALSPAAATTAPTIVTQEPAAQKPAAQVPAAQVPTTAPTIVVTVASTLMATLPASSTTPTAAVFATPGVTAAAVATVAAGTPAAMAFDPRPDLPRYVYVDQGTQHMYVLENGKIVRDIPCSTGLPDANSYTPAWSGVVGQYWGTFFAYDVFADEAWFLFKADGSILIHSLPYTVTATGGPKNYQDADKLGVSPASHGCIRISPEDAVWFTAWGPEGVPITVSDPYRDKWQ